MSVEKKQTIVFVCTGNTCRSPMAEALLSTEVRRLHLAGVSVCSAGVGVREENDLNGKSAKVLSDDGLTLPNFKSRKMTVQLLEEASAVICMTDAQRDFLREAKARLQGESAEQTVFSYRDVTGAEVPDPYGQDLDAYRKTYELLKDATPIILERFLGIKEETEEVKKASGESLLLVEEKPKKKTTKRKPSSAKKKSEKQENKKPVAKTATRKKQTKKEK